MNEDQIPVTDAHPPITDHLSEEWFAAAADHRLLIQRCSACDNTQFYPRRLCVHCGSDHVEWLQAAGTGRLHTFSVIHRTPNQEFAPFTPYVFAIVELDEGPRMATNVIGVSHEELRCDMSVKAVFPASGDGKPVFPCFTSLRASVSTHDD
jgi:uncharacterized protein